MGYLQSASTLPSFTKAVISFWFRYPLVSANAAVTAFAGDGRPLDGIIPLVVIGEPGGGQRPYTTTVVPHLTWATNTTESIAGIGNTDVTVVLATNTVTIGGTVITYNSLTQRTFTYNPSGYLQTSTDTSYKDAHLSSTVGPAPPTDPTVIGVNESGQLYINFETGIVPTVTSYDFEIRGYNAGYQDAPGGPTYSGPTPSPQVGADAYPTGHVITQTSYTGPLDFVGTTTLIEDTSTWATYTDYPGFVHSPTNIWADISGVVKNKTAAISATPVATVEQDKWHHVLLSIDLETIATHGEASDSDSPTPLAQYLDNWSRMFVAIDDVNYNGYDMGGFWSDSLSDKNAIFTSESFDVAATPRTTDTVFTDGIPGSQTSSVVPVGGVAQYIVTPTIPAGTVGIPAHSEFVNSIWKVEMAEFQMWTGVTLDTSVEANRRAFIDYRQDAHGNRTLDANGNENLIPVATSKAQTLMGKKAEIQLHRSNNWIAGKNTGGGAEQFTKTGTIIKYPDPFIVVT